MSIHTYIYIYIHTHFTHWHLGNLVMIIVDNILWLKKGPFLVVYKVMVLLTIDGVLKSRKCRIVCHLDTELTTFFLHQQQKTDRAVRTKRAKKEPPTPPCFLNKVLSTREWHLDFLAMVTIWKSWVTFYNNRRARFGSVKMTAFSYRRPTDY